MAFIFGNVVHLSNKINQKLTIKYVETYIETLEIVQSKYSSDVVSRLKPLGISPTHDYRNHDGAIPFPATFSIELAEAMTNSETDIINRLYSDYPFTLRKGGGPKDEFESLALTTFRFAEDSSKPFVRFEKVDGRKSMRYAKAMVMKQSCVNCHNTHPHSTKKDWKVNDVRGVREVIYPLDATRKIALTEWGVTVGSMSAITVLILGILFLAINALKSSISMLSKTNTAYDRFVPHEFLSYLEKHSIIDVQLSDSIEKQMTVLFSDIRSFTNLSEQMTPEENFIFLNNYYKVMGPVVRKHNGFIDKYIGDAIMALFDDADDAVNASIEMMATLDSYNQKDVLDGAKSLKIGIGLHKGKLRLGTVGEQNRMDGTVISDAVNLSSRIEGLTKYYGVEILITEAIYRSIDSPDSYPIRLIDKVKVKGKKDPITIYEVINGIDEKSLESKLALRSDFENAIALYQVKEFKKAKQQFNQYLKQLPDDKVAQLYLERCKRYLLEGIPKDWDGAFVLDTK